MHACKCEKASAGIHPMDKYRKGFQEQESWKGACLMHVSGEAADIFAFDHIRPDQIPGY